MKSLTTVCLALLAMLPATGAQQHGERRAPEASAAHSGAQDIVDTAVAAGSFGTLAKALQAAELVSALKGKGPFTVFAPGDQAFAALPRGTLESLLEPRAEADLTRVLTFHVVPGRLPASAVVAADTLDTLSGQRLAVRVDDDGVTVNGARVVQADIECSNGIIHVIDGVLLPEMRDIVAIASADERFSTLVAAVKAAGLAEALQGTGPLTVFAPTDEAFAALPAGTLESLLRPESKQRLVSILQYHVVAGRVFADGALEAGRLTTLQGGSLAVTAADDGARVQDASLVVTDVAASNGVIHVIDRVLLPR